MRRKLVSISLLLMMFFTVFNGIVVSKVSVDVNSNTSNTGFTHTVLAEFGGVTWCPHCPPASEALYKIYNSSDYPFYYVSFVRDKNPIAAERMKRYFAWYIPMVYFDGGYIAEERNQEMAYRSAIENSGERDVHNIDIKLNVTWLGDARIKVEVTIKNMEDKFYLGLLRTYVTEITSRWNDQKGLPFHFAFLDYAFNKIISIPPNGVFRDSTIWDGSQPHGNLTYSDITKDNIMVISAVSYWSPHIKKNPWDKPKPLRYIGFYVDQTTAATPKDEADVSSIETMYNDDGITNVTVDEVWDMLQSNGGQIPIDVRTFKEFINERIKTPYKENRARNFPLQLLWKDFFLHIFMKRYSGKEIILYCHSGNRSYISAKILVENNFNGKIYNMVGGITAWKNAGYPTITGLLPSRNTLEISIEKSIGLKLLSSTNSFHR